MRYRLQLDGGRLLPAQHNSRLCELGADSESLEGLQSLGLRRHCHFGAAVACVVCYDPIYVCCNWEADSQALTAADAAWDALKRAIQLHFCERISLNVVFAITHSILTAGEAPQSFRTA